MSRYNDLFSLSTFEKMCESRWETFDPESEDYRSIRCPRCNSERFRKYGEILEYKCGSSIGWGFLPTEYCYRKGFEYRTEQMKKLVAENKALRAEIDALKSPKNY
jgi:hypothetical protein